MLEEKSRKVDYAEIRRDLCQVREPRLDGVVQTIGLHTRYPLDYIKTFQGHTTK